MTAPAFNLDPNSAKKGSGSAGGIDETGEYTGNITLAMHIEADSGASGIQFSFESDTGQKSNYINVYTHGKDGNPIFGLDTVNALMTCLKLRGIKPEKRDVEIRDFQSGQSKKESCDVYPELMNKPVGLILRKEWYVNTGGEDKFRMALFAPFEASTGKLAVEVLDDRPAEGKDKIVSSLKDKGAPRQQKPTGGAQQRSSEPGPIDDFDDDIPF